jgi:hypothetical protein
MGGGEGEGEGRGVSSLNVMPSNVYSVSFDRHLYCTLGTDWPWMVVDIKLSISCSVCSKLKMRGGERDFGVGA